MTLKNVDPDFGKFSPPLDRHSVFSDNLSFEDRLFVCRDALIDAFGEDWLDSRLISKSKKPIMHPIQLLWKELHRCIGKKQISQSEIDAASTINEYVSLVSHLSHACYAKGYREYILERLKNVNEFNGAMFECLVAGRYLGHGAAVEFVAAQVHGQKTPDLLVEKHGNYMNVECKKIISYVSQAIDHAKLNLLFGNLVNANPLTPNMHVIFIILGELNALSLGEAYNEAVKLVKTNHRGLFFDSNKSLGVLIQTRETMSEELGDFEYNYNFVSNSEVQQPSLISLSCLKSNKTISVLNSLKDAKAQLNPEEFNLIAVQITLEDNYQKTSLMHIALYFSILRESISVFWRNNLNTRVKAIILVQGPYKHKRQRDRLVYNYDRLYFHLIPNPNFSFATSAISPVDSRVFSVLKLNH